MIPSLKLVEIYYHRTIGTKQLHLPRAQEQDLAILTHLEYNDIPTLSRASATPAVNALDYPALLQLTLGHAADAVGGEVGVSGLDAPEAAQIFIALLLPLGDQVPVRDLLLDAEIIQLA